VHQKVKFLFFVFSLLLFFKYTHTQITFCEKTKTKTNKFIRTMKLSKGNQVNIPEPGQGQKTKIKNDFQFFFCWSIKTKQHTFYFFLLIKKKIENY